MSEMRWINLRDGACPKCSAVLIETPTRSVVVCPTKKCGFTITKKRCLEIIKNMDGTRKWGKDSGRDYEENLEALNNL